MKKIIAVIPARAGSKGVPNKNVRFLAGKPLIAYAIENALASKYITDVIVTTDSDEVAIIANLKKVKVHKRDKCLCGDSITLDAVIHDAIKDIDADYIVTMQPTSPTLKSSTLDVAIEYAIKYDLDTLISAINTPHLAWTKNADGNIEPAYTKRLNRQFLPPYYQETGAFVISKRSVVTKDTRIGTNVEVFEIGYEESLDIDSFDDMLIASNLLKKEKVAFYVNGNVQIGFNSIVRALELADSFNSKIKIFYNSAITEKSAFGNTTHTLIGVKDLHELLTYLNKEEFTIFINDIGSTTPDYMQAVRRELPKAKIVNLEDEGTGVAFADIVFNSLSGEKKAPNIMSSAEYFIPNKKFLYYNPIEINESVKRVFISFGGIDSQDYSDRLLKIISQEKYKAWDFHIVLGYGKYNKTELQKMYSKYPNIKVYLEVSDMPFLMTQCDIGITSCGRTAYEMALLGIPNITLSQNTREDRNTFICTKNGFHRLGINPTDQTIEKMLEAYIEMPKSDRQSQQTQLLKNDLKNGCERIVKQINVSL